MLFVKNIIFQLGEQWVVELDPGEPLVFSFRFKSY
jgi:hypothetical protein